MKSKKPSIISKTVFISGIIVFIILLIGIVILASLFSFPLNNSQIIESEITIIAYSTSIPVVNPQIDKAISIPTLDSKNIIYTKGLRVFIHGTDGEGLRIHQLAGQDSPTIYLANEDDLYIISDGPIITGGYVWWQIKSLSAEEIVGWAAQDFLQVKINSQ
jgi:hypothetical protein